MTDRRALKALVRERMARTGESYSTAHRHVTAHAAARPGPTPGLLPGYRLDPTPSGHRVSTLTARWLGQAGVPVSEALACGLGGGIGFLYAVFTYDALPHPLLTVVTQHHPQPWPEAVAQHTGITTTTLTSSSPAAARRKLDAALDGGQAAWLLVGRGHLPWNDAVPAEEAADPLPVVVAGRSGADLLLDDGDAPVHVIAPGALADAWAAHRTGRFALTTIDPGAGLDPAPAVRAALTTTHAHLTGPVLGHAFDVNLGLSGMDRMLAQVRDATTADGWRRRYADPAALAFGFEQLAGWLTWNHGGPGATRALFAQFLREADGLGGLALGPTADIAERAADAWTRVADHVATAPTDDVPAALDALAALLEPAVAREHALAGALGEALAGG